MKKIILFSLTLLQCHFTLSMLTQKNIVHKIIPSQFHTTSHAQSLEIMTCTFAVGAMWTAEQARVKAKSNAEILQQNRNLLHEISRQNKENNELLRALLQQNELTSQRTFSHYEHREPLVHAQLKDLYKKLEEEHKIKIKTE